MTQIEGRLGDLCPELDVQVSITQSRAPYGHFQRGLPEEFSPPEFIVGHLMSVMPFGFDGKPVSEVFFLCNSVAWTFQGGLWNAQALCAGTESRQ